MPDLDKDQVTTIFEMLGMFEIGTFDWFQYNDRITGEITSVPLTNQVSFSQADTRLNAIITDIDAKTLTDGRQSRVIDLVTEYDEISLDTTRIGPGGASGATGARYNPAEQRLHLKSLLETVLGFALRQEATSLGFHGPGQNIFGGGSGSIPVIR